jgi:hypothetical protein
MNVERCQARPVRGARQSDQIAFVTLIGAGDSEIGSIDEWTSWIEIAIGCDLAKRGAAKNSKPNAAMKVIAKRDIGSRIVISID